MAHLPAEGVAVTPWPDALQAFGTEWEALVIERRLNPTMLPGWIDVAARTYAGKAELSVVVQTRRSALEGLIPFFKSRQKQLGVPMNVIELASNIVSYHAALACRSEHRALLEAMLDSARPWHALRMCNLPDGSELSNAASAIASDRGYATLTIPVEQSPYLPISTDWETYLASRPKKFRYKLRQRRKLLAEHGELTLSEYATSNVDTERLIAEIVAVEAASWKARIGRDIGNRPHERAYYTMLIPYLAEQNALHAVVLYRGGRAIAYSLCCRWNGWCGQLKTSFDEAHADLSPGSIVIDRSIQAAFELGDREFDFLGDQDKHKAAWTSHVRAHHDVFIYSRSLRSRMVARAKSLKQRHFAYKRKPTTKHE